MEALAVIWAPVRTLASVAEERRVLLAFGVVALSAALGLVFSSILVFSGFTQAQLEAQGTELPPGFEVFLTYISVFSLILAVVQPFVLWLVVSGVMQLVTRFFGGTGPFSGTLAVTGVAQVTLIISGLVGFPITLLQQTVFVPQDPVTLALGSLSFLLGLAFYLWYAALVVIGAAFARRVGYGQSAGSCAISCAGLVGLILIVAVIFGVLAAVLVGAVSPDTAS